MASRSYKSLTASNPTVQEFDITPDTRTLQSMGSTGQPSWKAIAELVDNSLDAINPNTSTSEVEIRYLIKNHRVQSITLSDNGIGMTPEQLANAFRIGRSIKHGSNKTIGMFGFGLKTAIASLGTSWKITTATAESKTASQISGSMKEFVENNSWTIQVNQVVKQNVGTVIEIFNCDINEGQFLREFHTRLAETFRAFLESEKLILTVTEEATGDSERIKAAPIDWMPEDKGGFKKTFDFEVNGKRVYGVCGMREYGSNYYGFSLIRNSRTITQNVVEPFFTRDQHVNRVIGEIHLDDFEVDNHKTGFNQKDDTWALMVEAIKKEIAPVISKNREYSNRDSRRVDKNVEQAIKQTANDFAKAIQQDENLQEVINGRKHVTKLANGPTSKSKTTAANNTPNTANPAPIPPIPNSNLNTDGRRRLSLNQVAINIELVTDGESAYRYRWEHQNDGSIDIYVNMDHPSFPTEKAYQHIWCTNILLEAMASYVATARSQAEGQDVVSLEVFEQAKDQIHRIATHSALVIV